MGEAIEIQVNGQPYAVPAGTTVEGLLAGLNLGTTRVAVERNRDIVPRAERAKVVLAAGDRLEVVSFVGGG